MPISFLTLLARWLAGWYLGARPRRLGARRSPTTTRISIIVPARNEAAQLPCLLASLASQTRRPYEVIVVDDASTDETAELARAAHSMVIDSGPLPEGWTGKTWACARGAQQATGDLFVFLDADTVAAPGLLDALAAEHAARAGLTSVQPFHRMTRPYERLSACFNIVAGMGIGATSMRSTTRVTGAYGPCLVLSRVDYAAIGGHAAVRSEVLEDVALARLAQRHGLVPRALAGGDLISSRMYPGGVRSLGEGWSKNFASGAGSTPLPRLLAIVAWISGLIEAGWWTWAGLALAPFGHALSVVHAGFYVLFALQCAMLLRRLGNFGYTAALFPIAVAAFVVVFFRSLAMTVRGEVRWKGRTVSTRIRVGG